MDNSEEIKRFFANQLSLWPLACGNFRAVKKVSIREFTIGGLGIRAQHNPARIISSAARTDSASINARPCFLCAQNRPAEQTSLPFEGRKGKKYDILVNPYPIFPLHLVIAFHKHSPQSIAGKYVDILDMARTYRDFTFFYNGPSCGASAPDHHHFQACGRNMMPLESDVDALLEAIPRDGKGNYIYDSGLEGKGTWSDTLHYLTSIRDAHAYHYDRFVNGVFVLRSRTVKSAARMFYRLLDCAPAKPGCQEPDINFFCWYSGGEYRTTVIFRTSHRSHHYFSQGPGHLTMSPGCADMGGLLIVPVKEDFEKIDEALITGMMEEVTLSKEQQDSIIRKLTRGQEVLHVGIMQAREICFEMLHDGAGLQRASYNNGKVDYNGVLYDELYFEAQTPSTMLSQASFVLYGVTIGIGFHWQRQQVQSFAGALRIIARDNMLIAINEVGVEDYLLSVISSEMRPTASLEFLKAHAVISRSWVLARLRGKENEESGVLEADVSGVSPASGIGQPEKIVRWYDRQDHKYFDVCADDHCQRYQGLTGVVGQNVRKAIDQTWGEVLTCGGKLCDARFSKCCGGKMELFSSCWDDIDYPYLQPLPDTPDHNPEGDPFCHTSDKGILSQVLNPYDMETQDFYEWTQTYGKDELSSLIASRSGRRIGKIIRLQPLQRGPSGRITELLVEGSEGSFTVGKELEIRKYLSTSHLKSSAFEIEDSDDRIILHGHGWGHGVGLCQIGAAVMSSRGYNYEAILKHYYPGSEITLLS